MSTNNHQTGNFDYFFGTDLTNPFIYDWEVNYAQHASLINLMTQCFWVWNEKMNKESCWLCDVLEHFWSWYQTIQTNYNSKARFIMNEDASMDLQKKFSVIKRSRKNPLPDIEHNLKNLLTLADEGKELNFKHSEKSAKGLYHGVSSKRSKYIGVIKNRDQWQVLLNEGKVKKYIGTYATEIEAAIVSDFYSIGINGYTAKTNFSYNHNQVIEMILHFLSNDNQFDPSMFIPQMY